MNITRISLYLISAAMLVAATSCSLFESKKGMITRRNTLPTDREALITPASSKAYTSDEVTRGVIRGDWGIITVNNKKAHGQQAPYLKFENSQKRVYGNNGCNTINASYSYNPKDTTLRFSNILSTMMACNEADITDYEINQALDATRYYSWKLKGTEYWLYFYNAAHQQIMSLMHQNFEFLNGAWKVTAIDGEPVDIPDMKLVIDFEEGKIHGHTGCNILNGSFTTDMDAANSLSFQEIVTTRMACPEGNRETDFLVALEDAAFAKPVSPTRVLLLDNRSNVVLQLDRIDPVKD